ncbi:hypothetical protein EYF80_009152 [Liparis tanakae]|uniref:Uncharacterized protein n=1 Tax=Liparis tanakae TaxID=230148 RepID=A0A4Z2IT02_9TELE|nr:hypothetical protein EYF80_009152 [Liparis tanakae]
MAWKSSYGKICAAAADKRPFMSDSSSRCSGACEPRRAYLAEHLVKQAAHNDTKSVVPKLRASTFGPAP